MRREATAVVLVILVAASVGAGYLAGAGGGTARTVTTVSLATSTSTGTKTVTAVSVATSTSTTTVTTSAAIGGLPRNSTDPLCGTVFKNGLNLIGSPPANSSVTLQRRLFVMPANSTATLCVSFNGMTPSDTLNSSLGDANFPGLVELPNLTYSGNGQGEGYGYTLNSIAPAPGITVAGVPHLLAIGDATYPVMVYTITASATSTGIYSVSYKYQCPPWIPIGVGFDVAGAQVAIAAGYYVYITPSGCIGFQGQPNGIVVGVGGAMDVGWVLKG